MKLHLRAGWPILPRGVELGVPTKEAGRGRPLRGVVGVEVGLDCLLSRGMPLLDSGLLLRDWRLVEVDMDEEPLIVGLT